MFKSLATATLLLLSFQSYAATEVWFTGTVKTVYPLNNGNFVITFKENQTGCNNSSTLSIITS